MNALSPFDVTFGKEIDSRLEQLLNTEYPIDVTVGKEIDTNDVQSSNA